MASIPPGSAPAAVGRSPIRGKPVGMLLLTRNATVTYCHSKTVELPSMVHQADIVIAAVGRPELIKGNWIRPSAAVTAGVTTPATSATSNTPRLPNVPDFITPVPGGIGPAAIAVLLAQTVDAAGSPHNELSDREGCLWPRV